MRRLLLLLLTATLAVSVHMVTVANPVSAMESNGTPGSIPGIIEVPPECTLYDTEWVGDAPANAYVRTYRCGAYDRVEGILYDDSCDDRTAYLDTNPNVGDGQTIRVSGCGQKQDFASNYSTSLSSVGLMAQACNSWSCSTPRYATVYA